MTIHKAVIATLHGVPLIAVRDGGDAYVEVSTVVRYMKLHHPDKFSEFRLAVQLRHAIPLEFGLANGGSVTGTFIGNNELSDCLPAGTAIHRYVNYLDKGSVKDTQ